MPIEEYIVGVVAGEMKPTVLWKPMLPGHLTRSFTMEFISRRHSAARHRHIDDHEEAQAYNADNITPIIRGSRDDQGRS